MATSPIRAKLPHRTRTLIEHSPDITKILPHVIEGCECSLDQRPFIYASHGARYVVRMPLCRVSEMVHGYLGPRIRMKNDGDRKLSKKKRYPDKLGVQERLGACVLCGRRLKPGVWAGLVNNDHLDVKALIRGVTVTVRACSVKCRNAAWRRFEEKQECLEHQLRNVAQAKTALNLVRSYLADQGALPSRKKGSTTGAASLGS